MEYDSKGDTLEHIQKVASLLLDVTHRLMSRAKFHDASKLEEPEKPYFDKWTPKLSGVTYGSDEYREMLAAMKPAIDHHQATNRHHPECYGPENVSGMDLIDIVEMICDWKAATERHNDGDIRRSLEINTERFNLSPSVTRLLENTINSMGW